MNPAAPKERRLGDRRAGARRAAARPAAPDESWFGAVGMGADTHWHAISDDPESRFDEGLAGVGGAVADSRFLARQAQRIVGAGQTAFERVYRAFASARAALGLTLAITIGVSGFFGVWPGLPVLLICLGYATLSISMWLLPRFQRPAAPRHDGTPAQPDVARHDRRRCRVLHRAAHAGAVGGGELLGAARPAGADGRRADAAPDGARHGGRDHPRAARRGLAQRARRRRRRGADDAGGPRRQRPVRDHGARERTRRAPRARGAHGARQPRTRAPAGPAQPARHRADARRRARRRPQRARARRQPGRARAARAGGHDRPGAVFAARRARLAGHRRSGRAGAVRDHLARVGARRGARLRTRTVAHASRAHPLHAPSRGRRQPGVVRRLPRGRAQRAGAHAPGKARRDGPRVGRHRARDPQSAGGDRASQRAHCPRMRRVPSSASSRGWWRTTSSA